MADLYGVAPSSNPEPEEISTFLNQLLHSSSSSSSSSSSCMQFKAKCIHSFPSQVQEFSMPATTFVAGMEILVDDRYRVGGSAVRTESEPRVNFSDPGTYFRTNVKDSADNALSSAGDFNYDNEVPEASEIPSGQERPRSSSKRSRAAEVHNLSEKKRRSRINEKMKALQNLIPNSNKTDKASMLDEAIEYLTQLQLQVQMLSVRNGLSLYPMCLPGVPQQMQLPPQAWHMTREMDSSVPTQEQLIYPNRKLDLVLNQLPMHSMGSPTQHLPRKSVRKGGHNFD